MAKVLDFEFAVAQIFAMPGIYQVALVVIITSTVKLPLRQ
jgi:hypothetical protein